MIDTNDIGRNGMIVQYEDIICMIGYNIAKYFHKQNIYNKLDDTSIKDVLLSYINREDEDYTKWLSKEYGIEINATEMLKSFATMQPNLIYTYKVFGALHRENINNIFIYSNEYSPIIEQATKSYGFDGIKYINGDICEFLTSHPNFTYITSSMCNLKKLVNIEAPVCLVVCDDYLYTSEFFSSKLDKQLREMPNIFLRYTSIISAGIL